MGWFGFGKDEVIDLTEQYPKKSKVVSRESTQNSDSGIANDGGFGFLSTIANSANPLSNQSSFSASPSLMSSDDEGFGEANSLEERKKKLAKRLVDMTNKVEDLSNQIYHLQQRLDLVERRLSVNKFE